MRRGSVGVSALKGVGRLSWMLSAVGPRRNGMTEGDNGSGDEARDRRKGAATEWDSFVARRAMASKKRVLDGVGHRLVRGGFEVQVEDDMVGGGGRLVACRASADGRRGRIVAGRMCGGGGAGDVESGWTVRGRVDGGGNRTDGFAA